MACLFKIKLCSITLLISSAVFAQTGNIAGTISRSTGAAIANAPVELENITTGVRQQAVTDNTGHFSFGNLPAGRYRIRTTGALTSTPVQEIVIDASTQPPTVNLIVQGTGAVASVAIQSATTSLDTTTPQITSFNNTRDIQYLPQPNFINRNGEGFGAYNLSLLNPGVANSRGIGVARGPVVGGQRPSSNNFYFDGVDNNNRALPGPLTYISNEATTEFVAFQNQFPPEWGHTGGGQFNAIVRSGTNQFHGALYDYLQNRNLNAVDQSFARQGITDLPRYDQNRLGGNFGFPIIKNKLFMFADFEYIPLGAANLQISPTYAPTASGYRTLAGLRGVSATNLNVLQNHLGAAPVQAQGLTTSVNGTPIPLGIVPSSGAIHQNQYFGVGSLDWNVSGSDSLKARYTQDSTIGNNNGATLPAFFSPVNNRSLIATVTEYHNFSPNGSNELRLGYNRLDRRVGNNNAAFPGFSAFPNIQIQQDLNAQLGSGFFGTQNAALNTYQISDNVNWLHGRHNVKFGYDGRRYIGPTTFTQLGNGSYTYSSLSRYALDLPPDIGGQRTFGNLSYAGNQWDSYGYVNDSWQMRSNFNVNLGVKYAYVTIPKAQNLQAFNSVADVPGLITFRQPESQKTAFAPLVGIAWSPGIVKNSVLRAGFGMNYDTTYNALSLPSVPPGTVTSYISPTLTFVPGFFGTGAIVTPTQFNIFSPSVTPQQARAMTTSYIPDQRLPYTMQWNANYQQAILSRFVLNIGYLGVRGVHLPVQSVLNGATNVSATQNLPLYFSQPSQAALNSSTTTLNSLQAAQSNNPYAQAGFTNPITSIAPAGSSTYHGLTAAATQRFSGGLQTRLDYTWSHLLDDVSGPSLTNTGFNLFSTRTQRGTSIYDRRQRATATALWDVGAIGSHGFNWIRDIVANVNIAGTFTYETGPNLYLNSGIDSSLSGSNAASGVFVNSGGTAGVGSGVTALTNSAGQTVGYLANNRNAQYIAAGAGSFPTGGRNAVQLRPINNFDVSAVKRFGVRDRFNFEVRGDAYNMLNHAQFTSGEINSIGLGLSSPAAAQNFLIPGTAAFGNITAAYPSHARTLQVALRVTF